jgi:hypothetical protein
LIPRAAITQHEREWIPELTRRFVNVVKDAREQRGWTDPVNPPTATSSSSPR